MALQAEDDPPFVLETHYFVEDVFNDLPDMEIENSHRDTLVGNETWADPNGETPNPQGGIHQRWTLPDASNDRIIVTFDHARKITHGAAINELTNVRAFMRKKHEESGIEDMQVFLVDYFAGPESNIAKLFLKEIPAFHGDYALFAQFYCTFMRSCAYQLSATELLKTAMHIKKTGCMSFEEYCEAWKQISGEDAATQEVFETRDMPLWKKVQEELNRVLYECHVKPTCNQNALLLAIDDDKLHCETKKKNRKNLKVSSETFD